MTPRKESREYELSSKMYEGRISIEDVGKIEKSALVNALPMIVISRWCVEKLSVRSEAQWTRDFFACLY